MKKQTQSNKKLSLKVATVRKLREEISPEQMKDVAGGRPNTSASGTTGDNC